MRRTTARHARGNDAAPRIALVVRRLPGGGGEEVMRRLARAFIARGVRVDVLARDAAPALQEELPAGARLVPLTRCERVTPWRWRVAVRFPGSATALLAPPLLDTELRYIAPLAAYLRAQRPAAVLAFGLFTNLLAAWAHALARTPGKLVLSEQSPVSHVLAEHRARASPRGAARWDRRLRHLPAVVREGYRRAHAVVAASPGVADDLATFGAVPRERIAWIPNPGPDERLPSLAAQTPAHPWFAPGEQAPLLAIGRLTPQKDFPTLLRALNLLPQDVRLVILGEGGERRALEDLARVLGIAGRVALPGHGANPFAYLARAQTFVLSSRFEGFGLVLVEALACGCPVVSTDCPYGPADILEGGRYGALVPVGDPAALASAIAETITRPPDPARLRTRALDFAVDRIAGRYLDLLLPGRSAQEVCA